MPDGKARSGGFAELGNDSGNEEDSMNNQDLAFNLADLTTIMRTEPILFSCMIQPVLTETTQDFDSKALDGIYVLCCPLSVERQNAIVEVIRRPPGNRKPGIARYQLRIKQRKYDRSERGRWDTV